MAGPLKKELLLRLPKVHFHFLKFNSSFSLLWFSTHHDHVGEDLGIIAVCYIQYTGYFGNIYKYFVKSASVVVNKKYA